MEASELSHRIALAFKSFKAFVFQKGLDEPSTVLKLLREAGIQHLVNVHNLPEGIYVVTINMRPCQVECKLKVCKGFEGDEKAKCLDECIRSCEKRVLEQIVERLTSLSKR